MSNDQSNLRDSTHPADGEIDPLAHRKLSRAGDEIIGRTLALVRFLRDSCPWDARQDPRSLRPYLLEEAHEVADAIEISDDAALAAELGDLLLNIAFQIVLAEEREAFDGRAVVETLEAKMRLRHPHIYGDADRPPDWEALKARERAERATESEGSAGFEPSDPFEGLPLSMEPLSRALRVQDRMAAIGFDWPDVSGPLAKVDEEAAELAALLEEETGLGDDGPPTGVARSEAASAAGSQRLARLEEELGDLLFAVVNVARLCGVHPSNALILANAKFQRRSGEIRRRAAEVGLDWNSASLDQLDELWEATKRDE